LNEALAKGNLNRGVPQGRSWLRLSHRGLLSFHMETLLEKLTEAIKDLTKVVAQMKVKQAESKSPPEREQL